MNEDEIPEEEEDAASDRTLVAQNEEENPSPEYRIATITPSANTIPIADEIHEDEEATLADPTIMTLQTPLPEQQFVKQQQQNIHRLMEKIERQRKAAQNRTNQQPTLITPTNKTPKKLIVSPGYDESGTSIDSSLTQQDIQEEQSSSNTTTAEIEERRAKLEFVFSFFLFKLLFLFQDLENKPSNNKYVFYLNELIYFHKILHVLLFHHHLIFLLKV
jgi:hypothetical protein